MILVDVDGCRYVVLDAWHEQDDQNALTPTENGPSPPAVPAHFAPTDQYRSWRIRDLRFGFLLSCDPGAPVEQWSWQRCRGSWRKTERETAAAPTATVTLPQRMYYSFVSFP